MIILLFVLRNNLVLFFVLKIIFNIAQWSLRLAKNFTCLPGDKLSPGRIIILDRVFAFSLDSQLGLLSQLMHPTLSHRLFRGSLSDAKVGIIYHITKCSAD